LGLGSSVPTFWTKIGGSELRGAPQKNWDIYSSADIVANNFKLVHNLDLGRTSSKQLSRPRHKLEGF